LFSLLSPTAIALTMTDYNYLPLDEQPLTFEEVQNYLHFQQFVSITFRAHAKIEACRNYLDKKIADTDTPFYGINTGFGFLQNVTIGDDQLEELQNNLLMSHACGMGEEVPAEIVKMMLMLKIKSLSYGYSGVQVDTVKRLMDMH
jgi:histidine ammonia-lyase